jgi:beta-ureidopropionase
MTAQSKELESTNRRVAAVQLRTSDDREDNIARAEGLIRSAADEGADLVVLPEIFAAPFVGAEPDLDYFKWGEFTDGPSNSMAKRVSAELGITVLSSIFERTSLDGVNHNSTFAFADGELVHHYRKSHLPFSNGFPEKFYFRPGDESPSVFQDGDLNVGVIICYERHFPELGRSVGLQGGHVMCVPVACASAPTKAVFTLELQAHAAFNSMYVICANRVGDENGKVYYGSSAIYGPDGTTLEQAGDEEGIIVADVSVDEVRRRRVVLPFFRDRRPDLYSVES